VAYGWREVEKGSPLRCMGKSAEMVEEKGVAWKLMKIKGLDPHTGIGESCGRVWAAYMGTYA